MRFSVVIATKGRPRLLEQALASLAACDPAPSEVLVVDGDAGRSAEPVVRALAGEPAFELRYLTCEPSSTRQRNVGIDASSGDVVVFADDDVTVDPDVFAALERAYEAADVVGAVGMIREPGERRFGGRASRARRALLRGRDGTMTAFGYPRRIGDPTREQDVEFMQGAFMSGRRELLARLRFDEHLGGYGLLEDEDLSYRMSRFGRLRHVPDAGVDHRNTGFLTMDSREFGRRVVVNRAYLFRKNFDQSALARLGFAGLLAALAAHRALNREWDGLRGLADGMRELWRARR